MAVTGDSKQELYFIETNSYLVKTYSSLQEVYVERITETSYKLRKERSDGTWYIDWVTKKDFEKNSQIIESLHSYLIPPPVKSDTDYKVEVNKPTRYTICPVCVGSGDILEPGTTAGKKICPYCLGGGKTIAMD